MKVETGVVVRTERMTWKNISDALQVGFTAECGALTLHAMFPIGLPLPAALCYDLTFASVFHFHHQVLYDRFPRVLRESPVSRIQLHIAIALLSPGFLAVHGAMKVIQCCIVLFEFD